VIAERPRLRVFLDAGVPDSVGDVFLKYGHEVIYHRNALPEKTVDKLVCVTALAREAILVGIDRDMRSFRLALV
jgi:predicted nuclease of predicted toxin-antitoxin system